MILKHVLPAERINLSVQKTGAEAIKKHFETLEGFDVALRLTNQEAITLDTNSSLIIFHLKDYLQNVQEWREVLRGQYGRDALVKALTTCRDKSGRILSREIIDLRARRDKKDPPAWQYRTQPLLKRMIAESGYGPSQFLKACGLKPGKIYNLPYKPKGEVMRKIKLQTCLPFSGEIKTNLAEKTGFLEASYIPLGKGAFLRWQSGADAGYNIHLHQRLPEIMQESVIGLPAADLVDDQKAKAVLAGMTITGFGEYSNGHQINLSREADEEMEPEPSWVEEEHQELVNRLYAWANS